MKSKRYILINEGKVYLEPNGKGGYQFPTDMPSDVECLSPDEWFTIDSGTVAPVIKKADKDNGAWVGLRESWQKLPEKEYQLAAKGEELLFWRGQHLYCGKCGCETKRNSEISRICSKCGLEIFPSPSPAILVLVSKGEEALLVHARSFSRPFYGLVAGFVETGESLEECVAREVREETSLEIADIKYFGSQSWPFPFNLMIGFTARYVGGELKFADGELSAGGFFSRENVPEIPTGPSLARTMIDSWLENKKAEI